MVLVHGAHVGPWCWDLIAPALQDLGHRVEAVELHRGSLAADTAATQEVVDGLDGPVVVCAWSYGGMVITGLWLPQGSDLVYLCALMPDEGETASSSTAPHPTGFGALVVLDEAGDLVLVSEGIDEFMWADAPADRAADARASLRSQAIGPLVEPPVRVAWRSTPSSGTRATPRCCPRPELVVSLLDTLATD